VYLVFFGSLQEGGRVCELKGGWLREMERVCTEYQRLNDMSDYQGPCRVQNHVR